MPDNNNSVTPFSLKDAPALIEVLFPAQKLSAEVYKERMAGSGQTLTALGSYWKGRKPLILNKACVLGCLLPVTLNLKRDLEIFELLMGMDDRSFVARAKRRLTPKEILGQCSLARIADYFEVSPEGVLPTAGPVDWSKDPAYARVKVSWRADIPEASRRRLESELLPQKAYRERVATSYRPEEVAEVHEHIWNEVNAHLGTNALSVAELVKQLGVMRFGHRPRVADTFSGSGQIPFEAARLGCDVYASDLNPVACMLTWGAFHIIGGSKEQRADLARGQRALVEKTQAEIDRLGIETDGNGWRAKVFLYCAETRCPQSGWLVPILPTLVVSKGYRVIAELVPDPINRRYAIAITAGVSDAKLLAAAGSGTVRSGGRGQDPYLVHTVDGREYPQFFGIRALVSRINQYRPDGGREGGIVWHTTGSGKSFTMVFLTKALVLHDSLKACRVVVVTDRLDLEDQLAKNFISGGAFGSQIATRKEGEKAKVSSGRELAKRIGTGTERIVFTLVHKFNTASQLPECYNPSADMIVLVDEGHRSHGGESHERMRKALPNAAYVAFTGTPLLKNEKTANKFGPIVHAYTMARAVEDGTVTPLLYEERVPELAINEEAVNRWFDKITIGLSDAQRVDLKKKFANKGAIYGAANRIELIAWDIAVHFSENIKKLKLGLKGQVATASKLDAIRYKKYLDETGLVSSAVIISAPDTREGNKEVDESKLPEVQKWWKETVGNDAEEYERKVLADFSTEGAPDLLIVVDRLLTGFDEPANTVLYIDKPLKEHNLIQAIARVNRLHEAKRYGVLVDYRGILKQLDTAIRAYQDLETRTQGGYELADIEGLYSQFSTEYKRLPGLHDTLWAFFKDVKNRQDLEQYRQVLMPKYAPDPNGEPGETYDTRQKLREDFYEALTQFGLCLQTALSSRSFYEDNSFSEQDVRTYKEDLRFFTSLRKIARQDAMETVDYSVYEEQIRRLVDKQVIGKEVREPEGVYMVHELGKEEDPATWSEEKTRNETDIIRTRLKRTIEQDLADDPYAQKVFAELLKQAIAEAEAMFDHPLKQYALFKKFEEKVEQRDVEGIPDGFGDNPHARAYFGAFRLALGDALFDSADAGTLRPYVEEAHAIDTAVRNAVAENSLNPQNIEAAIRKSLLPRLFSLMGLDKAKEVIELVIQITRLGLSRGNL